MAPPHHGSTALVPGSLSLCYIFGGKFLSMFIKQNKTLKNVPKSGNGVAWLHIDEFLHLLRFTQRGLNEPKTWPIAHKNEPFWKE